VKRFLLNTLVFCLVLVGYGILNILINTYRIEEQGLPFNNPNILIIGDSHLRKALNPDVFHCAVSLTQNAEPLFLSYWKLKAVLQRTKVDTVILGIGLHKFGYWQGSELTSARKDMLYSRSYWFDGIFDEPKLKHDYESFLQIYLQRMCLFPSDNHWDWIGGFSGYEGSSNESVDVALQRHRFDEQHNQGCSILTTLYLEKILGYCLDNNIALIFVGTPVLTSYLEKVPAEVSNCYLEEMSKLTKQGFPVYNATATVYSDSLFYDGDHLNVQGSIRFGEEFVEWINRKKQELLVR